MATHSSILAWRIPWTEEPGGLQSTGSQSRTRLSDFKEINWENKQLALAQKKFKKIYPIFGFLLNLRNNFFRDMWVFVFL